MTFPAPSRLTWLGIAREPAPGQATLPAAAVPVDQSGYEPEDTPGFILDTGLRASLGAVAGAVLATGASAHGFTGPLFADSGGWWLDNLFGDLSTVSTGTLGTAQPLAVAVNVGDTQLTASASLGSVTTGSIVQIGDGPASEVVVATAGSTGTVVRFAGTPARFAHTTSATAALQTAASTYTHTFAVLNSGSGLPPTHTVTDTTGLTATTGARCYPYVSVTQIDLAGNPGQGWVTAKVSAAGSLSQPSTAATVYPSATGYVLPFAGWQSTVLVGGILPYAGAWAVSMKRKTVIYRSPGNPLAPVTIARGGLEVTGSLAYPLPSDETPLSQMLSGAQPPVQISLTNGVTGTGALALTLTAAQAQFTTAKTARGGVALGYGTAFQAIDSGTNAGGSGGIGPIQVQLVNAVAAY